MTPLEMRVSCSYKNGSSVTVSQRGKSRSEWWQGRTVLDLICVFPRLAQIHLRSGPAAAWEPCVASPYSTTSFFCHSPVPWVLGLGCANHYCARWGRSCCSSKPQAQLKVLASPILSYSDGMPCRRLWDLAPPVVAKKCQVAWPGSVGDDNERQLTDSLFLPPSVSLFSSVVVLYNLSHPHDQATSCDFAWSHAILVMNHLVFAISPSLSLLSFSSLPPPFNYTSQ